MAGGRKQATDQRNLRGIRLSPRLVARLMAEDQPARDQQFVCML
jgi:hypothetical protein